MSYNVLRLSEQQQAIYHQVVEVMDDALRDKWPLVTRLYPQKELVPRTFAVLDRNQVVGGLIWKSSLKGRFFEIYSMAVAPSMQRKGIGRVLLEEFENFARQALARGAKIDAVVLDAQNDNWRFYNKQGFTFTEEVTDPDNAQVGLEMRKLLRDAQSGN